MARQVSKSCLTVRQRRENDFFLLIEGIIQDHRTWGFYYAMKTFCSLELRIPILVQFMYEANNAEFGIGPIVQFDKDRIVIDVRQMYELPVSLDEVLDSVASHHKIMARGVKSIRNIIDRTRHLYKTPKRKELQCMLSAALGEYFLSELLKKHPESWLHEKSLISMIIRGGLVKSFYHFYTGLADSVSQCVWKRFWDDDVAKSIFWSSSEFREKAGCVLVSPVIRDFRGEGLLWFVRNTPRTNSGFEVHRLPEYADKAYQELSTTHC